MNRTALCLAILVPWLAVACSSSSNNGSPGGNGDASLADVAAPDASSDADTGVADAAALTDGQIVGVVITANTGEIEEAFLAVGTGDGGASELDAGLDGGFDAGTARASDPAVKAFANMMIADHSMSNGAVMALGIPAEPSSVQTELQTSAQSSITQLSPLSGRGFDTAYMQAQVATHTAVRDIIQSQLIPSAHGAELKAFLQNMLLPTVDTHLMDAATILATLTDGGAPDASDAATAADAAHE
jgi:predicted outer membrane protein